MANVTNQLIANITTTEDTTGAIPINRSTGNPAFDSSNALMQEYIALGAGTSAIVLPTNPCTQVYIRNIDPNGKSVVVRWTPTTLVEVDIVTLYPTDQIINWSKPGDTNAGISTLKLTPSAAGCLIEFFLGG